MKKTLLILLFFSCAIFAQNGNKKREFRAAWIATVSNIDFPSNKNLNPAQQQNEFIQLLDQHQQAGLNAVVVQIRSNADALYPSELEPWSEWLTGAQGRAPNPLYDPLTFMISECRKRGMEFHAWFNPYRAVSNITTAQLAANHVARRQPNWLLAYGNLRLLDPGQPEVRAWVTRVVMDVVRRYDVDGVHFDDYFYPYPVAGQVLNDDSTFAKFGRGFTDRGDWRRQNVDLLIKMVSDSIRQAKPYVKFGVSPFGIWKNKSASQPDGSDTRGLESFNDIFANSLLWAREGWTDYLAPQLYWNIGLAAADYEELVGWWTQNASNRHVYIGQAVYKINSDANWNATQMPRQLRMSRHLQGHIFYNTNTLNKNLLGFRDSLRTGFYQRPALPPLMAWKRGTPPPAPQNLVATLGPTGMALAWSRPAVGSQETAKIRSFGIYRFGPNESVNLEQWQALRAVLPAEVTTFVDTDPSSLTTPYVYVVTALNRLAEESGASNTARGNVITALEPAPLAGVELYQNFPNPFMESTTIRYSLPQAGWVRLQVLDALGRSIAEPVNAWKEAGTHEVALAQLPAGFYTYTLESMQGQQTKKMWKW
jgi:uncharacterized lipoprotein YddW (UPF0748 family)